jgi:hypothetical protein
MDGVTKKTGVILTGEMCLRDIPSISIKLENGQVVTLKPSRELRIPDDPVKLLQEAAKASARYAFWAYQEEMQLGRVRTSERHLAFVEGGYDQPVRDQLHEQTPGGITESAVKAVKDTHNEVCSARAKLDEDRRQYGILRVMRKALDHRCFALDRLVARMAEVHKG